MLEFDSIQRLLPHRYPFLFVDRVLELEAGKRALAIKNVSGNEEFFQGHFPGHPVMPGVLILEAMAQVAGLALMAAPGYEGRLGLFAGIDQARFRRQVVPGDQLQLEAEIVRLRGTVAKARAKATVAGELAAEADLMFAVVERPAERSAEPTTES